jgi:preprotein translocase subunit SecA
MASRDPLVEYQREGAGMFATMMDSVMEEVVGFLFRAQLVDQPAQPAPIMAGRQRQGRGQRSGPRPGADATPDPGAEAPAGLKRRSTLDAEAAAARSELSVTAKGIAASPASTTVPGGRASMPITKSDTTELRSGRPGQPGRRNEGKKKRK